MMIINYLTLYSKPHLLSLCRGLAPPIFGSIYSWSLTNIKGVEGNEHALGFPLNQYFAFFILSFVCMITAIIAWHIPGALNQPHSRENNRNVRTASITESYS